MIRVLCVLLVAARVLALREQQDADASVEKSNASAAIPFWKTWKEEASPLQALSVIDEKLVGVGLGGMGWLPGGMSSFSFGGTKQSFEIRFRCDGQSLEALGLTTHDDIRGKQLVWGMEDDGLQVIYEKGGEYERAEGHHRQHIRTPARRQGIVDGLPAGMWATPDPFRCSNLDLQVWQIDRTIGVASTWLGYQVLGTASYSNTKGFAVQPGEKKNLAFEFIQSCEPLRCANFHFFGDDCRGGAQRAVMEKPDSRFCHRGRRGLLILTTELQGAGIRSPVDQYVSSRVTFYLQK
eukprot:TRINITY_DN18380_c0_g1_i1.p1 TRINITY_DN18380_c0_g1~~TRINITY_DN18380_c0_g1_i1.p1  ORF type:complete len:294 (-),score=39.46 TRINITY_DN18380_c0_g1_i1:100-981(-)